MAHDFEVYPCSKSGKLLRGFCLTKCDGNGLLSTVSDFKKFSEKFNIKYYAFRDVTLGTDFSIVAL